MEKNNKLEDRVHRQNIIADILYWFKNLIDEESFDVFVNTVTHQILEKLKDDEMDP